VGVAGVELFVEVVVRLVAQRVVLQLLMEV
jgi:hypothetical protein